MDFIQSQWNSFLGEFKGMNARQLIGQGTNLGIEYTSAWSNRSGGVLDNSS